MPRAERNVARFLRGQNRQQRQQYQHSCGNETDNLHKTPPHAQTNFCSQQKTAGPAPCRFRNLAIFVPDYFLFTDFFSSAPGLNFATLRAAILIVAPVCGLRPFRAFLCDTEKVPKPINATRSPLRSAPVMLSTAVSMAVVACALLISHAPAILSTRSALFIVSPRRSLSFPAGTGRTTG